MKVDWRSQIPVRRLPSYLNRSATKDSSNYYNEEQLQMIQQLSSFDKGLTRIGISQSNV